VPRIKLSKVHLKLTIQDRTFSLCVFNMCPVTGNFQDLVNKLGNFQRFGFKNVTGKKGFLTDMHIRF